MYKLADLGFAKDLNKQSLCHTLVGTLQYVAPELFISEKYTNTGIPLKADYARECLITCTVILSRLLEPGLSRP